MTNLAEARRKVRQEDRDGVEARIAAAAQEMAEDVRMARVREAVAKQRVGQLAAREQTKQAILEACGGAMVAIRTTVAELRKLFELYSSLRDQTVDLKEKVLSDWSHFQILVRYGYRLAAELSGVSGLANALGTVKWSVHGSHPAGADWIEGERKILAMRDKP